MWRKGQKTDYLNKISCRFVCSGNFVGGADAAAAGDGGGDICVCADARARIRCRTNYLWR